MTETANTTIRFDLLRKLNDFVQGLPAQMFYLDNVVETPPDGPAFNKDGEVKEGCGAVACAMGWAGMHPEFKKMGLFWDKTAYDLKWRSGRGKKAEYVDFAEAARRLFNVNSDDAVDLFGTIGDSQYDTPEDYEVFSNQHRGVLERRMKAFFAEHGQVL